MKRILLFILVANLLFLFAGCGAKTENEPEVPTEVHDIDYAICFDGFPGYFGPGSPGLGVAESNMGPRLNLVFYFHDDRVSEIQILKLIN